MQNFVKGKQKELLKYLFKVLLTLYVLPVPISATHLTFIL